MPKADPRRLSRRTGPPTCSPCCVCRVHGVRPPPPWYHRRRRQVEVGNSRHALPPSGRKFEQGRGYERAVRYRRLAAENALDRWAYYEAISHLIRGVEIHNRLPDTPERARQELDFQASLGLALMLTKGFAASEVGTVTVRAAELCQQIGESVRLFPLLWQLRQHHIVRGETHTAYELAERLLSLAEAMQDADLLLQAYLALGNTLYYRGEPLSARTYLKQGMALYQPQQDRSHRFRYAADPKTTCLRNLAWTLWLLGYPDQALEKTRQPRASRRNRCSPQAWWQGWSIVLGCTNTAEKRT